MARSPFPTSDFGRNLSGEIYRANHTSDVPSWATSQVADTALQFSRSLRRMADQAYTREGEAAAAADVAAGGALATRPGHGVDDEAYNTVIREQMLAQRQTAYLEGLDRIETEADGNMAQFATSMIYHDEAFKPTGDAQVDASMARFVTIQRGAAQRRVRAGEEARRRETVKGAFVTAATTGRTALGQSIASAGLDGAGAQLVSASLNEYAATLARFGPREAFSIGDVEFAADSSRAGVMSPDVLAQAYVAAANDARLNWIYTAGRNAPDVGSKRAFLDQVQERWAAGDPIFAGLDSGDMLQLTGRLEAEVNRAEADERAAMQGAGADARDMLRALEFGGDVDEAELRARAAASGDVGLQAEIEYRLTYGFNAGPGGQGGAGGEVGAGFEGWVEFLLDRLEGPDEVANDNGRGRARYGITEASHPEAWRDGRIDRLEAARIYRREYWDAIGADQLDPELAFVASAAAVIGGAETAKSLLRQANGDPERFLQLEEARFRRLAAEDPAKYGDDLPGWLARQGRIRGALGTMRAQRRSAEGYASDPVDYARGNSRRPPLATVAEFDPAAVFEGGDAARAWGAAIRDRYRTAQALSQRDGVPVRILDNAEAAFYKSRIETDPGAIIPLAAAAGTALGGDGARAFLQDLDRVGVAGPDVHLAWLALEPRNGNIVRSVVEGRRLRQDGAKAPDWGTGETLGEAFAEMAPAFAAQPDITPAVRSLAEDMAIADEARGQRRSAGYYLNGALGATSSGGRRYGGVVTVNGAPTIAPDWLEADQLEDALEIAARLFVEQDKGPVYESGREVPAAVLSSYRLRAMPNGTYQLINPATDRPIAGRDGRAFEMDFDREDFRALLARRLRGSVLEGR